MGDSLQILTLVLVLVNLGTLVYLIIRVRRTRRGVLDILAMVRRRERALESPQMRRAESAETSPAAAAAAGLDANELASLLESVIALYRLIDGDPVLPLTRRFAPSLDFARHLIQHIRTHQPRRIVECEGGISTIAMAYAIKGIPDAHIWSVSSNSRLYMELQDELQRRQLSDQVTLISAPLVEREYADAVKKAHWYDLAPGALPEGADMLVVGESFGTDKRLARYPVGAELFPGVARNAHIFLAPGLYDDDQRLASLWRGVVPDLGVRELGAKGGREMFYLDRKMEEVIGEFENRLAAS